MPSPSIIDPVVQKTSADCAIASLAMLLNKPYAEVSAECLRMTRKPHKLGLGTRQVNALAKRLGTSLVKGNLADIESETGILYIDYTDGAAHAVLLFEGIVVNPADGLIYSLDTYLAASKSKVNSFWKVA